VPIFEYRCKDCDRRFEAILQGASRAKCPGCSGSRLEKQHSVFAVAHASASGADSFDSDGACGSCGDPRGPGSCASDSDD
jgi:putative FmdB family regulatory protein